MRASSWPVPRPLLCAPLALLLVACGVVEVSPPQSFPRPLIEPLPIAGTLVLSDEFRTHSTATPKGTRVRFAIGPAQSAMFIGIFEALLADSLVVASGPGGAPAGGLRIEPSLTELQHVAPRQNGQGAYEVWVRYRVQVSDDDAQPLADWQLSGYGRGDGWEVATTNALRDLGAQLGIGFARQTAIAGWIGGQAR